MSEQFIAEQAEQSDPVMRDLRQIAKEFRSNGVLMGLAAINAAIREIETLRAIAKKCPKCGEIGKHWIGCSIHVREVASSFPASITVQSMTDSTWCPKHLRTIGALVPCSLCEEERKGLAIVGGSSASRIAKLEKEVAGLKDALCANTQTACEVIDERDNLQKEVAGLRANARRYEWLRSGDNHLDVRDERDNAVWGESLDSAIDAQLAAMRTERREEPHAD